tara:strand:- start:159 stop:374 length:216 start_codon:yes stop_codon:yes gene_type:complete
MFGNHPNISLFFLSWLSLLSFIVIWMAWAEEGTSKMIWTIIGTFFFGVIIVGAKMYFTGKHKKSISEGGYW